MKFIALATYDSIVKLRSNFCQIFASEADRLKGFEQEARATSALNHPNILTVYDIGEHEGSPFIVAELLPWSTQMGAGTSNYCFIGRWVART